MSKDDKDLAENGGAVELTADALMSAGETQTLPLTAVEPTPEPAQSEQSRQFNSWLDRALPRLMQYLGNGANLAVTSPSPKAKH